MLTSPFERFANWPSSGLYQQDSEKDACGLALVATLRGTPGHDIIQTALDALRNLDTVVQLDPTQELAMAQEF